MSVFLSGSLDVINCTFEQQGACSWHQSETDDTDWIWTTGSTSTSGTGPSSDHTIGPTRMSYFKYTSESIIGLFLVLSCVEYFDLTSFHQEFASFF